MSSSSLPTVAVKPLSDNFSVAGQLEPAAMAALAAAGFRAVINNRPDSEGGPEQPSSASMEAAALAVGLSYRHLPVSPAYQSPAEITAFKQLLATLPTPVLAFCRSGARSTKLFLAATQVD